MSLHEPKISSQSDKVSIVIFLISQRDIIKRPHTDVAISVTR